MQRYSIVMSRFRPNNSKRITTLCCLNIQQVSQMTPDKTKPNLAASGPLKVAAIPKGAMTQKVDSRTTL